jgi:SAM-dependent methyltransferase
VTVSTAALPLIMPVQQDWPILWQLADRLRELGFDEAAVNRSMGLRDYTVRDVSLWPSQLRHCRLQAEHDPCGLLTAFFFLEESVPRARLEQLLGAEAVDCLDRLYLIDQNADGSMFFRFQLHPLMGQLILTDGHISNRNYPDQVYPLGSDSHTLARTAVRPLVSHSLDLCTGSGVHAVLAGAHCERAFGLDINPRALDFACFNAIWNQRPNVAFLESDCYQQVDADTLGLNDPCQFDLITANPPFVPTPEAISLCRGGGETGEEVTEKIVAGLPRMLKPDGIFSMVTNVPHFRDHTFFERCERWLGGGQEWGMVCLNSHYWSLAAYVASHIKPGPAHQVAEDFKRWLDSYAAVGLETLTNSQVYLFRSPYPWRIDRSFRYPDRVVSPFIESWLASLRALQPGSEARYRLHPGLEKVWWQEGRARVFLEWDQQHRWWQPGNGWLEGALAEAVERFSTHPEGLPARQFDLPVLAELLSEHLITLA